MNTRLITTAALLALALAGVACAKKDTHASTSTAKAPTSPPAASSRTPAHTTPTPTPITPAPANPVDEALLGDYDMPTQADAELEALQSIDDSNADAEFEKLKQELSGG